MCRVELMTQNGKNTTVSCREGENLLELMRRENIPVDAPCSGGGTCGKCRIKWISGDLESDRRIPGWEEGWRLACQSTVQGDCTLWIPDSASDYRDGIQTADQELDALKQLKDKNIRPETEGVSCAVDIGTTTVSAVLLRGQTGEILAKGSRGNAQICYGGDVIHRIMESCKPGGRERLQSAVLDETLTPLLAGLCRQAKVAPGDIKRIAVGANTTMNHLLLGVDANPIRMEPYTPVFLRKEGVTAGELRLPADPAAPVILAPNVGSYVGGDITAGCMASMLWDREELSLLIDLGTNGELVLGNREFLLTCACSAGPAFEGGDITCGMRATPGAVEGCTIRGDDVALRVIGGGRPVGICGSGLIDTVAQLFESGLIDAAGKFTREGGRITRDDYGVGRFRLAEGVFLTETDIDNFIRAKGAVFSAIVTLLKTVDLPINALDRVYVAGGIGSGIHIPNAIKTGMLPDLPPEKFRYIGNASLAGACAMAVSRRAAELCQEVADNMTYLELSTYPGYMEEFVAACFLPHTDRKWFRGLQSR